MVAPLKNEAHTCSTCGTSFRGNYCPRCGQSSRIGRYSLKQAFLLFLDVWGLGNRGMFRTMRDLLLRPGYMIRDYLQGMQMAYFPPFKMFFLLATFSILVSSGFNIAGKNTLKENRVDIEMDEADSKHADGDLTADGDLAVEHADGDLTADGDLAVEQADGDLPAKYADGDLPAKHADGDLQSPSSPADGDLQSPPSSSQADGDLQSPSSLSPQDLIAKKRVLGALDALMTFADSYPAIFSLFILVLLSAPIYLFFRRCPAYPDLSYSELLVALVYTANMASIFSIIFDFLQLKGFFEMIGILLPLVPLHQLSGYRYRKVIVYVLLSIVILGLSITLVIILLAFFTYQFSS